MNTKRLEALLKELVSQVADHYSLASYNPDSTRYRLTRDRAVANGYAVQKLESALQEEPELSVIAGLMPIRTTPNSGAGIQLSHVAQWMLAQARQKDPSIVLAALIDLLSMNEVETLEVMPLWGLHPKQEIHLEGDIKLMPLAAVPPSEPKDMLTGIRLSRDEDKNAFARIPRPKAALIREFRFGPLFNPFRDGDRNWQDRVPRVSGQDERMRAIAQVLSLVAERPVFPLAHWFQIPEETPLIRSVGGWGGYEQHLRFVEEVKPQDYDAEKVQILVHQYLNLPSEVRRRLEVPLDRLRLALVRGQAVDMALELGIGLEALLTQEQDSEAPISYRMRLRATHLLGGGEQTRQDNAKRFRILYQLRSRAAHGADVTDEALKKAGGNGPVEEYIRAGALKLAEMIRRIILTGRLPDWEGFVMGWEKPIP